MSNTPKSKSYVVYDKVTGQILAVFGTPFKPITEPGESFIEAQCDDIKLNKVNIHTLKVESVL